MPSRGPPLLEARVEGVWGPQGTLLLGSLELVLEGPGIVSVLGDTGSGKTTLLRLLSGLIPHVYRGLKSHASIRVGGTPVAEAVLQNRVFMVPNPPGAHFLANTVGQELELARARPLAPGSLASMANRPVDLLSEGEKYLLLATAAVVNMREKSLLLVDEPQSNLDDANYTRLARRLQALSDEKNALVLITGHEAPLAPKSGEVIRLESPREPASLEAPDLSFIKPPPARAGLRDCTIAPPGARPLIRRTSLELTPGEAVAITGPNGSGKTSLLKTLAGLMKCREGEYRSPQKTLRYLPPPAYHVFTRDTVAGEMREPASRWRVGVEDILSAIGLKDKAARDPYTLSTGESRILLLSRYLLEAPSLLLLDEPLRGLDPARREIVLQMLRDYVGQGGTIVAAMLRPSVASGLFDRVYEIREGRLVEAG